MGISYRDRRKISTRLLLLEDLSPPTAVQPQVIRALDRSWLDGYGYGCRRGLLFGLVISIITVVGARLIALVFPI